MKISGSYPKAAKYLPQYQQKETAGREPSQKESLHKASLANTGTAASQTVAVIAKDTPGAQQSEKLPVEGTMGIEELLEMLRKEFSNVQIQVGSPPDKSGLKEYVVAQGKGLFLLISPEYLEKISGTPEKQQAGIQKIREVLGRLNQSGNRFLLAGQIPVGSGAVIGEDSQAVFWSTSCEYRYNYADELKKQREERKKEDKPEKKKVHYDPALVMSKVLAAKTAASARSARSSIHGTLNYLESCRRLKSYDKASLKSQINHARNMAVCAKKRVKNLETEERMRKRAEKAMEEQKMKEAMALRREMEKARKNNRIKEYSQMQRVGFTYISEAERRRYLQELGLPAVMDPYIPAVPAVAGGVSTGSSSGGAIPANISVSISSSINVMV